MPIVPTSDKPKGEQTPFLRRDMSSLFSGSSRVPVRELAVFCRKLSVMLGAGTHIKQALTIVRDEVPGRVLKKKVAQVNARVQQGDSFSLALTDTGGFPAFFCGFVSIGEATARLPQVMEQLADFYDAQAQTSDELTAALVYPVAVTVMMIGVIIMAITFVLPGYSRIFDATGAPLPALTQGLLDASDFLVNNGIRLAIGFFVLIIFLFFLLRTQGGRNFVAVAKLRVPLVRQGVNFRITQALHLLISAGLSVSQAMPLVIEVMDNVRVKRDMSAVRTMLEAGMPFWVAISDIKYIDPLFTGLARVGEETGRLGHTMEKCREYYAGAYKRAIKRLSKLIEPIITLVLGIGLGIIMLAVVLPTFELAAIL